jgi:outer membrane protein insertion porin family
VTLAHDTRDIPFAPTQGHLISASYEQAFGEFDFPRGDFEWAQYFMLRQRPDMSGRHTAGFITKVGVSGSDTPIFENYFAGGFSTLRGYQFRGASPRDFGVIVGGRFQWLNSAEYYFPLTADDMIRGTIFCDFGTVERSVGVHWDQFRVAPGFGFRINIPAMGPAPLAFDFAFPIASADTDREQIFSFFFGASR